MKAVLATNHPAVDHYILKTHLDILIIAQADSTDRCMDALSLDKPDLVISSDILPGNDTWDNTKSFLAAMKEKAPDCSLLILFTKKELTLKQMSELNAKGIGYLNTPISEQALSRSLYNIAEKGRSEKEPGAVAIWSPKPGDGSSLVTEAVSYVLCDNREKKEDLIGVVDCHLRRPYLKYRYQLDESTVLDDLLPYISSGSLNPEILQTNALFAGKRRALKFIGGVARPELFGRYGFFHFNALLETASKTFSKTIIDAGGDLDDPGTVTALRNADLILTVLQPCFVSKICLKHSLELFPALGINPHKLKLVLNRFLNQAQEDPQLIMSGVDIELLGTLTDIGQDANNLGEPLAFSGSGNRAVGTFLAKIREILAPVFSSTVKEEDRKGKLYKMITRGVG